jgi:hypothetical protein
MLLYSNVFQILHPIAKLLVPMAQSAIREAIGPMLLYSNVFQISHPIAKLLVPMAQSAIREAIGPMLLYSNVFQSYLSTRVQK